MPPPLHIDPPSLTPTYTFTVPTVQRKHTPAPGCPLCTILTTLEDAQPIPQLEQDPGRLGTDEQPFSPALPSPAVVQNPLLPSGPRSLGVKAVAGRLVLVDDDDLTAWVASKEETLTEEGRHVVVAFKRHVEDVYTFGPQDIPLLSHALQTAHTLLDRAPSHTNKRRSTPDDPRLEAAQDSHGKGTRRIGLVTGLTRDPQFPYTHLHVHATLGPHTHGSWYRRSVVHNGWNPGWWNLEDLIAEIREVTSNNRVKSGYGGRKGPLTGVPTAGSSEGLPNALEPPPRNDTARNGPTNPGATEPTTSAIQQNDSTQDNVPPALLDAVIRDAERTFGVARAGGGSGKGKGKQRAVEPEEEEEMGAVSVGR